MLTHHLSGVPDLKKKKKKKQIQKKPQRIQTRNGLCTIRRNTTNTSPAQLINITPVGSYRVNTRIKEIHKNLI